ncbi:MAG: aminotransferase class V-fold PLP-dependent enzyme [Thermoanaerobaculia bacterium]|nr:aminotransferase class V-fold PLP-dependent enzyme [Thermoanaerobaculia bacterium]
MTRAPVSPRAAQISPLASGPSPKPDREQVLAHLRAEEFARLDEQGQIYLDYTGGGLYAASQVRRHAEFLLSGVYGNPHSENPTSSISTELTERVRRRVLDYFSASPEEYAAIFTANASHALKLVGEAYPFESGDRFLLTSDNHNSVNGIREFDRARGAETTYLPLDSEMRVGEDILDSYLKRVGPGQHNLFAFPAQSNFSGVQHPLEWIERAHENGWDVLLDAAAFVPTNRLDLSRWKPDFVVLSFYKMFGYPTGIGALLGRREALRKLRRPWFAGGTITAASVQADRHILAQGEAAFEDGTPNYTAIPAIEYGFELLEAVGIDQIHAHVDRLTGWLIDRLVELRHENGQPVVHLYGPRTTERRGGTLALNFFDSRGRLIDHERIEAMARQRRMSIRTGCFCNPGAGESAFGLSKRKIEECLSGSGDSVAHDQFRRCVASKEGSGAVRVSMGLPTNLADVATFVDLARELLEV